MAEQSGGQVGDDPALAAKALQTQPEERDLRRIADNCGDNWKSLLTYVGLKNSKIKQFKIDENASSDACFQGLVYWRGGNVGDPNPVNWSTLLTAMKEAGMASDAREWKQKIIKRCAASLDKPRNAGQSGNDKTPTPEQEEPRSNVPTSATVTTKVEVCRMAERPGDGSSDQDMESGPVEDPPLLVSPHRVEGQQSTEQQRSGDTGRQAQGVVTIEPTMSSTGPPLVSRHGGFVGPINVKGDVKETPLTEDRPQIGIIRRPDVFVKPDNEIRADDKVRRDDKVRQDNDVKPNDEVRQTAEISPDRRDDENKSIFKITLESNCKLRYSDRIRPNDDVGTDVEVTPDQEVRLDGINVGDEDRPNKPSKSVVNVDSEAECAMQGDIFEAAQSGNVQTVKNYLDLGIPPDLVDEQGWSILHHAASHDQVDVMRLLHSKGCSVNPRDRHGCTPLHHAASSGASASIGVLVEELGSEVNPVDEDGFTPLKRSVECEQYAVMKELLRCGRGAFSGKDLKAAVLFQAAKAGDTQHVLATLQSGRLIDPVDSDGCNALHWAAAGGAVEMIDFLIKRGFDVNRGSKTGSTALHLAAREGHQEVVSTLVDAGCPIEIVDSNGCSALHYVAGGGAVKMIPFLIKCGLDVNRGDKTGGTALHLAARYGHQKVVSTLVDAGCPIDIVDSNGQSALHWAAGGGVVEMIDFLIKCGLDVNRGSKTGVTALHVAARYGHQEVVLALVDAGCPLDVVDSNGWSALHWAARGVSVEMIDFLIKCGLDVNRGDKTGVTALHVAANEGHQEVVSALVDAGCPIDIVDSEGQSALHWAAQGGAVEMIPFLIKCGLDVNRRDTYGRTALHGAALKGHQEVIFALVDAGRYIDVEDPNIPPTPWPISMPSALAQFHGVLTPAISGPAPHRSREVPTAPMARMEDKIDSSLDICGVEEYNKGLIGDMKMLGAVLGIVAETKVIISRNDTIDSQLLEILERYIAKESPTWRDFCTALKRYYGFNNVREKIERDHNSGT